MMFDSSRTPPGLACGGPPNTFFGSPKPCGRGCISCGQFKYFSKMSRRTVPTTHPPNIQFFARGYNSTAMKMAPPVQKWPQELQDWRGVPQLRMVVSVTWSPRGSRNKSLELHKVPDPYGSRRTSMCLKGNVTGVSFTIIWTVFFGPSRTAFGSIAIQ